MLNTTFHWEKLTSSFDGSCSNLNLSAASGSLSGSEETGERVVVSNSSILEFDPVVFGDEGCYRCVVGGVPSDIIYSVTSTYIFCMYALCENSQCYAPVYVCVCLLLVWPDIYLPGPLLSISQVEIGHIYGVTR